MKPKSLLMLIEAIDTKLSLKEIHKICWKIFCLQKKLKTSNPAWSVAIDIVCCEHWRESVSRLTLYSRNGNIEKAAHILLFFLVILPR
jgi:hypothetical protein